MQSTLFQLLHLILFYFIPTTYLIHFRVDQIVMSKPAGGPKPRSQGQDED